MTLNDVMQDPQKKDALVKDAGTVVEEEVASKKGIGGLAVKTVFAMVKKLKPGIIEEVLQNLLPRFVAAIEPIMDPRPSDMSPGKWLQEHSNEVVQALLGVTDERAKRNENAVLRSGYEKLRPTGEKHVAAAIPRLAQLLDKHLGG